MFPVPRRVRRKRTARSRRPGRPVPWRPSRWRPVPLAPRPPRPPGGTSGPVPQPAAGRRRLAAGGIWSHANSRGTPDKQTHRWPLEGQPLRANGAIWPAPPPSQLPGAETPRHRCFRVPRPIAVHGARPPAPLQWRWTREPANTRELPLVRTSAPLRTPRRCWPEYARAH